MTALRMFHSLWQTAAEKQLMHFCADVLVVLVVLGVVDTR